MTTELKTIIAGLVPHVADALQTYAENSCKPAAGATALLKARARIEGYLIAARNSGNLLDNHCDGLLEEIRNVGHFKIAACFPAPLEPLNEGERSLYRWQYKVAGGFEKSLWSAIMAADSTNLAALANAFPEHVAAYQNFAHTSGYWDALVKRANKQ